MKLRLLDDSIRLRLSRTEVTAASEQGVVEGQTRFPGGSTLTFALEALTDGAASASYEAGRLVVALPSDQISGWAGDEAAVSLHGEVPLPDGSLLKLLVEKDFQCLTGRPDEDQSDLFANPQADQC